MILPINIYSDGAVLADMKAMKEKGLVNGFTTNPSLMKKAGITNYLEFAKEAIDLVEGQSISFEVFGDDAQTMEKEAKILTQLGDNVYVKIPCLNTKGEGSYELIHRLSHEGIKLNVTALFTPHQVQETINALADGTENIISVFAGRIADTGVDPMPIMDTAATICQSKPGSQLLWASTRELYNIIQAIDCGCDIITVPPSILNKLDNLFKDLTQVSTDTVIGFNKDIQSLGFSILED